MSDAQCRSKCYGIRGSDGALVLYRCYRGRVGLRGQCNAWGLHRNGIASDAMAWTTVEGWRSRWRVRVVWPLRRLVGGKP